MQSPWSYRRSPYYPVSPRWSSGCLECSSQFSRHLRHLPAFVPYNGCNIKFEGDEFQIILDVKYYALVDLSVKIVNADIVVEGKHTEDKGHLGCYSWQFTRRYSLPEGYNPECVKSRFYINGYLIVTASKIVPPYVQVERKIPIAEAGVASITD